MPIPPFFFYVYYMYFKSHWFLGKENKMSRNGLTVKIFNVAFKAIYVHKERLT